MVFLFNINSNRQDIAIKPKPCYTVINMFLGATAASFNIIVTLLKSIVVVVGVSFYGAQINKAKLKYLWLFLAIAAILYLVSMLVPQIRFVLSTLFMGLAYALIFKKTVLNVVLVLFYALLPFYILNPLLFYLIDQLAFIPTNAVQLLALIVLLFGYFAIKIWRPFKKPIHEVYPFVLIIVLVTINIVIYVITFGMLSESIINGNAPNIQVILLLLAIAVALNMLIVYSFVNTKNNQAMLEEYNELKRTVLPLIENNLTMQHDLKTHLIALKKHISQEDIKGAQYIDEIANDFEAENEFEKWKKAIIGALIIQKKQQAEQVNAKLTSVAYGVDDCFPLPDYLLVYLISSMLDYAIINTKTCGEKKRTVYLVQGVSAKIFISITICCSNYKLFSRTDRRLAKRYMREIKRVARDTKGELSFEEQNTTTTMVIKYRIKDDTVKGV